MSTFKFARRSGIFIPKKYSSEPFYERIKEFLTRRMQNYHTPDYTIHKFYLESDNFLLIPRFVPLERFVEDYEIIDKSDPGLDINIAHIITPRNDEQKRAMQFLLSNDSGIIQLNPGMGKTVISIHMVATRKKKTLILVHKDSLVDQWIGKKDYKPGPPQGFLAFTSLTENDICRLTSATYKTDLQKSVIICTDQTFLSLLKRNRTEFLKELNNAGIGIFIGDEVHTTVGAPTFAECSIHIPARCSYGLSATPYRLDGNEDIIKFHTGQTYIDKSTEGTMKAKVMFFLFDFEIDTPKRWAYIHWGGVFQKSRYLTQMKKSKPFMDFCGSLLKHLKGKRDLVCVVERLKLADAFSKLFKPGEFSFFLGSEKMEQLKKSDLTFVTPGKMRDGVDAPHKDCVILTSPISNIKQMTGRIIRTNPESEKLKPLVIDMIDTGSKQIANTFFTRLKFYENENWDVEFYAVVNNQMRKIEKETAIEIAKGE
jgi:superfamily II DNA or RNA helicase